MINSILLLRPFSEGKVEFPFGLLFVGTALKQAGYKVKIIDFHLEPEREADIFNHISENNYSLIGISCLAGSYFWLKDFTLSLKVQYPQIKIIVGGHIASISHLLLEKTGTNFVCLAEGEEMLPRLIEAINSGADNFDQIPNLAYKKNNQTIKTPIKLIAPENFLTPDFSLVKIEKYFITPRKDKFFVSSERYQEIKAPTDRMTTLIFSRGCMGGCTFCYRHLPGYRQPPVEWCWQLLKTLYFDYQVKFFRIDDELFTSNPQWFTDFYERLVNSEMKILFRITGLRVDTINEDLLDKLYRIGCIGINYGIESGSQAILDKMNKRTTVAQNIDAIEMTLKHNIQAMAYIMFGNCGETNETLRETLDMLLKTNIRLDKIAISYTLPMPGTKLYIDCRERGLIKDEEQFISDLYAKITHQHQRYKVQLGEVCARELFGFEKKFILLLKLKEFMPVDSAFFRAIKFTVFLVPNKCRLNAVFMYTFKVINRLTRKYGNAH